MSAELLPGVSVGTEGLSDWKIVSAADTVIAGVPVKIVAAEVYMMTFFNIF